MADVETARQTDSGGNPSVEADIPANILPHLKAAGTTRCLPVMKGLA